MLISLKIPLQQYPDIFDQICGLHFLARLTHKLSHKDREKKEDEEEEEEEGRRRKGGLVQYTQNSGCYLVI